MFSPRYFLASNHIRGIWCIGRICGELIFLADGQQWGGCGRSLLSRGLKALGVQLSGRLVWNTVGDGDRASSFGFKVANDPMMG